MTDWGHFFKGKRITVLGLGLLGRAAGDAKFLAEEGAELIVTDLKDEAALRPSVETLKGFRNITFRLGGHDKADFRDRDFILKAAGVPLDSPYVAEAKKNGIPVKMGASWFAELTKIPVVGVTGTRGKSTVTHLLYDIMKATEMEVLLGGNVRGVSTLSLLPRVTKDSIALFELDSWQCQGFGEAGLSPNIAIFTNFMQDHMNYYRGDMDAYLEEKAQIFLHQKPDDTLVAGAQAAPILRKKYGTRIVSHVVIADPAKFPDGWKLRVLGAHNFANAVCAIEAARVLGIDERVIKSAVEDFAGIPGRLELVRELKGVKIYNDTNSTTPEATIAALHAIPGSRAILIMGGADKGLDISELVSLLPAYAKRIVLLPGSGTERVREKLPEAEVRNSLAEAVAAALAAATAGDTILFSPAFASFGMFANEFDRGDQFMKLIKSL